MGLRRWLSALLYTTALVPAAAVGEPLTPEEKSIVDRRLAFPQPHVDKLKLAEGSTHFGEKLVEVPSNRITKKLDDLEGLVTGIVAPKGVTVHDRVDELSPEPAGPKTKVRFVYAIHVDPGVKAGGKVRFNLTVVERTGLANTLTSEPVSLTVDVVKASPKADDLVADFWGYRYYKGAAEDRIKSLEQRRVSGLSIKDGARLPPLDKLGPRIAAQVYEFDRERRRIWVAHRHLVSATQHPDPKISGLAKSLVENLDKAPGDLKDVPKLGAGGGAVAKIEKIEATEKVETLQPTREEPAAGGGRGGGGGTLAPTGSYELGSEDDEPDVVPESPPTSSEPAPPPAPPGPPTGPTPGTVGEDGLVLVENDPFGERQRRVKAIPGYFRSLLLDDPNIGYGGGVRFVYARADFKGNSALSSAIFYSAYASITRFLGLELTVPTQWVNVELERTKPVYGLGNPQLAAKYRLYLDEVEGRRPALTFRARWALPISAPHSIPPTVEFKAEDFTREVYFTDAWAFNTNQTALGLGLNAAYQYSMVITQIQLGGDYFLPMVSSAQRFVTLNYGASVGVVPFGDLVGFFLEARATTTFIGATRTELFTYLGARGRFADLFEPSLWVGLPIGTVADVTGLQLGVEVRLAYDVPDVVGNTEARRETTILE